VAESTAQRVSSSCGDPGAVGVSGGNRGFRCCRCSAFMRNHRRAAADHAVGREIAAADPGRQADRRPPGRRVPSRRGRIRCEPLVRFGRRRGARNGWSGRFSRPRIAGGCLRTRRFPEAGWRVPPDPCFTSGPPPLAPKGVRHDSRSLARGDEQLIGRGAGSHRSGGNRSWFQFPRRSPISGAFVTAHWCPVVAVGTPPSSSVREGSRPPPVEVIDG